MDIEKSTYLADTEGNSVRTVNSHLLYTRVATDSIGLHAELQDILGTCTIIYELSIIACTKSE